MSILLARWFSLMMTSHGSGFILKQVASPPWQRETLTYLHHQRFLDCALLLQWAVHEMTFLHLGSRSAHTHEPSLQKFTMVQPAVTLCPAVFAMQNESPDSTGNGIGMVPDQELDITIHIYIYEYMLAPLCILYICKHLHIYIQYNM